MYWTIYALALDKVGVPAEVHLFAKGGHAFGLRDKADPIGGWPLLVETGSRVSESCRTDTVLLRASIDRRKLSGFPAPQGGTLKKPLLGTDWKSLLLVITVLRQKLPFATGSLSVVRHYPCRHLI